MSTVWKINTHGDPLKAVKSFLQAVWFEAKLDAMLVPVNGSEDVLAKPHLVEDPEKLDRVNPFRPLMTVNAAALLPKMIQSHPQSQLAALLRPCEMRALIEMTKHDSFTVGGSLTICVDCLGTYPADEYSWRAARKESSKELTREALQFARQGGIMAYRYRSACQTCSSPEAKAADINIQVIGLPVRQAILVETSKNETDERLSMQKLTDGLAETELVEQHQRILGKILERHRRTTERITQGLGELLPADIYGVIDQLEGCGTCQRCMNVCPICSVDFPYRDEQGHYQPQDIIRWLISCAGCGMCEQTCANHLPLSMIFGYIRSQLAEEYGYIAGQSFDDQLPL